jgi:hypothetical protein
MEKVPRIDLSHLLLNKPKSRYTLKDVIIDNPNHIGGKTEL